MSVFIFFIFVAWIIISIKKNNDEKAHEEKMKAVVEKLKKCESEVGSDKTTTTNSSNAYVSSNNSYSSSNYSSRKTETYSSKKNDIKEPTVVLYEAIKKSKETNSEVNYKYGTYVKNGILYDSKGSKIKNRDAFFKKVEDNYIKKHGYDKEHMDKKNKHKKEVDKYLKNIGKR